MQAMILAAGFGTRLRPYTEIRPKPLFPILNKPLLLLTVKRLRRAGFDHIIVNGHHLKEQIRDALCDIEGVIVQEEETVLGTGGGLRLAMQYFRDEPVLVSNGDIYHTVDLRELYTNHCHQSAPVTLALHDYPRFNCIEVKRGQVCDFDNRQADGLLAFTGLHVIEPEALGAISLSQASCIIDLYRTLLDEGRRINVARVDKCFWTDMGTLEDYLALHGGLIKGDIPCWDELQSSITGPLVTDDKAKYGRDLQIKDWACVGTAEIGDKVLLERSVLWDDVRISDTARIVDSLIAG